MRYLILPLVIALAGCAQTPAQEAAATQRRAAEQQGLAKELAGLVPDKPTMCLTNFRTRQLKAYGPTLIYSEGRNLKYRSDTAGGCEGVARGDILVTVSPTGQLCSGDIARTVSPTSRIPSGSCSLGEFIPYRKPRS